MKLAITLIVVKTKTNWVRVRRKIAKLREKIKQNLNETKLLKFVKRKKYDKKVKQKYREQKLSII